MSTVVPSHWAGVIWQAVKRHQIKLYNLNCSEVSDDRTESGVMVTSVGRTASWASCARFPEAYRIGLAGKYEAPYSLAINSRAAATESLLRLRESVRM